MRGTILGAIEGVDGGVILPRGTGAAAPVWSIAGTTQVTEEAANAVYTVSYVNALSPGQSATIAVASAAETAADGADYTGVATSLTFTAGGATAKTVAVTIVEDTMIEGAEDFIVAISGQSAGAISVSQVNTQISDDDASNLQWSISGTTQLDEGDPGTYTVGYTGVTLGPGQQATITVATADLDGGETNATAGSDYTALSTVLTFTAGGVTQKTVEVLTIDGTDIEGTEDFRVTIGGQSVGTLATSQANTLIVSDDAGFAVDAATFDGTNDYLSRGATLTGASDSSKVWGSLWYRKSSAITTNESFFGMANGNKAWLYHSTFGTPSHRLRLLLLHPSGGPSFQVIATIGMDNDGDWHHVAWYADTNHAAGAKVGYIFHDGVDVTASKADVGAAFDIHLTSNNINIGSSMDGGSGIGKFSGDLAEFIFAPGQNFDISNSVNLAKLRSGTGKPVDVGVDGSIPSGVAPLVYLHLDNGETPADNFGVNAGPGGGMTVNGALAVAASSPSD